MPLVKSLRVARNPRSGTITVYSLDGQAVQAATGLTGFGDGLAALVPQANP